MSLRWVVTLLIVQGTADSDLNISLDVGGRVGATGGWSWAEFGSCGGFPTVLEAGRRAGTRL